MGTAVYRMLKYGDVWMGLFPYFYSLTEIPEIMFDCWRMEHV